MKIGSYMIVGHRGTKLEKLQAQVKTHVRDPVLKSRPQGSHAYPSLALRRAPPAMTAEVNPTVHIAPTPDATSPAQAGARTFPRWQPKDRFLIALDDRDKTVRLAAKAHAIDRRVPANNSFHLKTRAGQGTSFGTLLDLGGSRPLARVGMSQRLDLIAHGWTNHVDGLRASQLADLLVQAGLRSVGVLKLQTCHAGTGNFLVGLRDALAERHVQVGYLCGPTGELRDARQIAKVFGRRVVVHPFRPLALLAPYPFYSKKVVGEHLIPETFALKVVKGNVDIAFPGTRYSLRAGPGDRFDDASATSIPSARAVSSDGAAPSVHSMAAGVGGLEDSERLSPEPIPRPSSMESLQNALKDLPWVTAPDEV